MIASMLWSMIERFAPGDQRRAAGAAATDVCSSESTDSGLVHRAGNHRAVAGAARCTRSSGRPMRGWPPARLPGRADRGSRGSRRCDRRGARSSSRTSRCGRNVPRGARAACSAGPERRCPTPRAGRRARGAGTSGPSRGPRSRAGIAGELVTAEAHAAAIRGNEAGHEVEDRGLARAVRPDEPGDAASRHRRRRGPPPAARRRPWTGPSPRSRARPPSSREPRSDALGQSPFGRKRREEDHEGPVEDLPDGRGDRRRHVEEPQDLGSTMRTAAPTTEP